MKKQRIANSNEYLVSSNNYTDDDCPVCQLMRKANLEKREPTKGEVEVAMRDARNIKKVVNNRPVLKQL